MERDKIKVVVVLGFTQTNSVRMVETHAIKASSDQTDTR